MLQGFTTIAPVLAESSVFPLTTCRPWRRVVAAIRALFGISTNPAVSSYNSVENQELDEGSRR